MPRPSVSHTEIARALAELGERAGPQEVAEDLRRSGEPFEAQMRRRIRTRPKPHRDAYLTLARAGSEKVRFHLEETGVIARCEGATRRRPSAVVRVGRRRRKRGGGSGQAGGRP